MPISKRTISGGWRSALLVAGLTILAAVGTAGSTQAEQSIKVGKAVPVSFAFVPLDVGVKAGIFAKHGLNIQIFAFQGSGKLQQAIAANSIDIALGAGPEFQAAAKGSPSLAVAEIVDAPRALVLIAMPNGPSKLEDFKGQKIGISGRHSLTDWLAGEIATKMGWPQDSIQRVALGAEAGNIAALKAGQIDGAVVDVGVANLLVSKGEAKIVASFGDIVGKNFITHIIEVNKEYPKKHGKIITAFIAGWFESVAYMKAHKEESVKIAAPVMGVPESVAAATYDQVMPMFTTKGTFQKDGLARLNQSFVDMGSLPAKVDLSKYYTEAYLPPEAK